MGIFPELFWSFWGEPEKTRNFETTPLKCRSLFVCHFSWRTNTVPTNISNISHQRGGFKSSSHLFFWGDILERYSLPWSSLAISACLGSNASRICTRVGAAILCIHRHWPPRLAAPNAIRCQQNMPTPNTLFVLGGGRNVGCMMLGFEIAIKVSAYHQFNQQIHLWKKTSNITSGSFPPAAI